jgi:hypothetical protein
MLHEQINEFMGSNQSVQQNLINKLAERDAQLKEIKVLPFLPFLL